MGSPNSIFFDPWFSRTSFFFFFFFLLKKVLLGFFQIFLARNLSCQKYFAPLAPFLLYLIHIHMASGRGKKQLTQIKFPFTICKQWKSPPPAIVTFNECQASQVPSEADTAYILVAPHGPWLRLMDLLPGDACVVEVFDGRTANRTEWMEHGIRQGLCYAPFVGEACAAQTPL